ncbi:hypothetical protein DYB31_013168 [Aphanomyces astaci]|uniref:Uncharacterized protein n=1 Tax=Aphanomyces astaci TaxID=112090 RepID=A0A397ES19_APHAT|nr:hypothetical protein DYB31_013168 [Aphanomyces astaci]
MGGSMTTLATETIDRLETTMRHLEDMYGYVTNADLQGHARTSMLTELGSVILEATKAADATIALFHDTYANRPSSPPKPTAAALLSPTTRQLLMDLHVEFHAKKAEFKNLRRRVGDAKRHTKMHIQDHTHVLRGLERLQHDMPL